MQIRDTSSVEPRRGAIESADLTTPIVLLLVVSLLMLAAMLFLGARALDSDAVLSSQQRVAIALQDKLSQLALDATTIVEAGRDEASLADFLRIRVAAMPLAARPGTAPDTVSGWIFDGVDHPRTGFIGSRIADDAAMRGYMQALLPLYVTAHQPGIAAPAVITGFIRVGKAVHLAAVAMAPLRADVNHPALWPRVALTRALGDEFLNALSSTYGLAGADIATTAPGEGRHAVSMQDTKGVVLAHLSWRAPTPGRDLLDQVWFALASVGLVMVLLIVLFFRRARNARARQLQLGAALQRERELRQLKSRFAVMVGHELRTPLATVQAATDLLRRRAGRLSERQQASELAAIQREVDRMLALLNDVLAVAQVDADVTAPRPEAIDVEATCQDLWREAQHAAGRIHPLQVNLGEGCRDVAFDPALLRAILSNLFENAIKFSPQAEPVTVDVDSDGAWVTLRVVDRGCGIPLEEIEAVFQPFHRAGNVDDVAGTGLGLTIVKQSVERHGGSVSIASEVGAGTEVLIRLPAMTAAA